MKNVTIKLDEAIVRWLRARAAEENMSVSGLVGDLLRRMMEEGQAYDVAMKRFFSRKPTRLKRRGRYPTREELHDRNRLR